MERLFDAGADLAIRQRGSAQLAARQAGFDARLAGASRYANPYGGGIEQRDDDPESIGWLWGFAQAWWDGWNAADSMIGRA